MNLIMNYYEILEISKSSDTKSIKKHYYSLSKKYHPDKNKGATDEKFKLLLTVDELTLVLFIV